MELYLSNHANVRKTNFCNAEGQVLYKSETPVLRDAIGTKPENYN